MSTTPMTPVNTMPATPGFSTPCDLSTPLTPFSFARAHFDTPIVSRNLKQAFDAVSDAVPTAVPTAVTTPVVTAA